MTVTVFGYLILISKDLDEFIFQLSPASVLNWKFVKNTLPYVIFSGLVLEMCSNMVFRL